MYNVCMNEQKLSDAVREVAKRVKGEGLPFEQAVGEVSLKMWINPGEIMAACESIYGKMYFSLYA
jgi:hypothetical protein